MRALQSELDLMGSATTGSARYDRVRLVSQEEFEKFIERSIVSCTTQTKEIPMTYLISGNQIEALVETRSRVREQRCSFGCNFEIDSPAQRNC